ncbi:MAG: hypothetical protein Q9198_003271 [Flavoplaca austrocitrina]
MKISDVSKGLHGAEPKDKEKEQAARVRWLMDRRDEMRRQLRELEVEKWEEREEKERREKEEKEKEEKEKEEEKKERRQFSQAREGEQRVAGGAKRKEGRDYELARKRLGKLFSDSRRIVA